MKNRLVLLIICLSIVYINSCNPSTKENDNNDSKVIIIGTFNIEWLGDGIDDKINRNEIDYKRIAETISENNVDVIALQEIENKEALRRLLKYLPNYNYIIGNIESKQNTAVVFKKSLKFKFIENYEPLSVKKGRTRAGLVVEGKKGNFDFLMMVVHLKSTSRYDSTDQLRNESYELRAQQAEILKTWADSINNNSSEKDIIIVGDFNDNPLRNTQILYPLYQSNQYVFLTKDLASCKNPYWDCIDHIVINRSVFNRLVQGSLFMYDIHSKYSDLEVSKISDHCPIFCRFDITAKDND